MSPNIMKNANTYLNNPTILIAGGSGFLGKAFIKYLNAISIKPYVLVHKNKINEKKLHYTEIENFENHNLEYLNSLNVDIFYVFSWQGSTGVDRGNFNIQSSNLQMAINYFDLSFKIKAKKVIFAGTITEKLVDQTINLTSIPNNLVYAFFKDITYKTLSMMAKNLKQNLVWVQLPNIYSETLNFNNIIGMTVTNLTNNLPIEYTPADQYYDFVHINDVSEGLYLIGNLANKKDKYYIGSSKPKLLKNYLYILGKIFRKENLILIGAKPSDNLKYALEWFDISELEKEFNYNPKYEFELFFTELRDKANEE